VRVAIDTAALIPPRTGIGHFSYQLVRAMLPLLAPEEALIALNDGWGAQVIDLNLLEQMSMSAPSLQLSRYLGGNAYVRLRETYPVRMAARAITSAYRSIVQGKIDLFHAVNYVPSVTVRMPVLPIIYDLSYIRLPATHPPERVRWLEQGLKGVASAPAVQTISEFSKSEIVSLLGVAPEHVHVTYPAPGPSFGPKRSADDLCLQKYHVAPRQYFLVVGAREPRKNVKTVAEAFVALPMSLQSKSPLLWVGPPGWGDLSLSPAATRAFDDGRIRAIGYVPDEDLAALYRNSLLFLMPSLYEGFGIPVVEALACGANVALSKIPVFEEVAGAHARYVEAMDVDGWRLAMNDALRPECLSGENCSAPDLSRFSWEVGAANTLTLYRRLTASDRTCERQPRAPELA
jgi:glycosyltransferase involved in cell wall biosynthesis